MMPDQPASPSHDAQDLEESDMQNVPDSNLQDSDRFTLPNNELLQQIHQLAKEISAGKLFMAGALESSVLIALGILVQEMEMMENSPETYEMLDDRLVASKAPNLFDVFGIQYLLINSRCRKRYCKERRTDSTSKAATC